MTMDEVHAALCAFERDLAQLNGSLRTSLGALQREHDRLSSVWRDRFARDYEQRWESFGRHLERYLRRDAPRYEAFVRGRIRHLDRYLGDG